MISSFASGNPPTFKAVLNPETVHLRSLAAQCRRQFGLKDCEQMILSVGKGPWTQQADREKKKVGDLEP